jgi:hypothetical protein
VLVNGEETAIGETFSIRTYSCGGRYEIKLRPRVQISSANESSNVSLVCWKTSKSPEVAYLRFLQNNLPEDKDNI